MGSITIVQRLQALVVRHGSQKAAARVLGVTPQYFNDVLHGRRDAGRAILKGLRLRVRTSYEVER